MKILDVVSLAVPEVRVLRYARFRDDRGFFAESFRAEEVAEALSEPDFVVAQANESASAAGVVRGLHFQFDPWQGKLVRPLSGRLVDIAVDIRKGSPTFGLAVGAAMDADPAADEAMWIWVPPGFAHGAFFPVPSTIEYLVTAPWSAPGEAGISPLAPDLGWSLCDPAVREEALGILKAPRLSEKDRAAFSLAGWKADPRSDRLRYAPSSRWSLGTA